MEKIILEHDAILRALKRMAHEILERNQVIDDIILVGIQTRGIYLAERLAKLLFEFENITISAIGIDVRQYRDDVLQRKMQNDCFNEALNINLQDKIIILVDDVFYTGRTVRAAMEGVLDYGRPKSIQLATLIDRGHRELPIRADYIGKNIPTARNESVKVQLVEIDHQDAVSIVD